MMIMMIMISSKWAACPGHYAGPGDEPLLLRLWLAAAAVKSECIWFNVAAGCAAPVTLPWHLEQSRPRTPGTAKDPWNPQPAAHSAITLLDGLSYQ